MGNSLGCVEREGHEDLPPAPPATSFPADMLTNKTSSFHLLQLAVAELELFFRGPLRQHRLVHYQPTFVCQLPSTEDQVILGCRPHPGPDLADYRSTLFSFFGLESEWPQALQHSLNSYLNSKNAEIIGAVHSGEANFLVFRQGQSDVEEFEVREVDRSMSALALEAYLNTELQGRYRFRMALTTKSKCMLVLETLVFTQKDVYLVLEVPFTSQRDFCKTLGDRLEHTLKGRRMMFAGIITGMEFKGAYVVFIFSDYSVS